MIAKLPKAALIFALEVVIERYEEEGSQRMVEALEEARDYIRFTDETKRIIKLEDRDMLYNPWVY